MSIKRTERRRFIRVPVGIMLSVRSEEEAELFTTNYSTDLSLGGMFIKTFDPKPIGTSVVIKLPIDQQQGYSEIHGEVASHGGSASEDGVIAGMGIKFTRMDSHARHALQQFINGNWRRLFQKPECLENEDKAYDTIENIIGFLDAVLYFPFGR